MNPVQTVKRNTDLKIVTSVVVGLSVFGLITYAAVKSGVKPLASAARVVKGAK